MVSEKDVCLGAEKGHLLPYKSPGVPGLAAVFILSICYRRRLIPTHNVLRSYSSLTSITLDPVTDRNKVPLFDFDLETVHVVSTDRFYIRC